MQSLVLAYICKAFLSLSVLRTAGMNNSLLARICMAVWGLLGFERRNVGVGLVVVI